jgi:tRNA (guanine6-N2)-methyltransferase
MPVVGPRRARAELLARTTRGIEWIAAEEIRASLPVERLALGHREVRFALDRVTPRALGLGTVDDLFVVAGGAEDPGRGRRALPALGAAAHDLALERALRTIGKVRTLPARTDLDVVASWLGRRSFSRYEAEDAVGGAIAARTGWIYRSRSAGLAPPQTALSLCVHLDGSAATLAFRLAGRPLHRRAYRDRTRPGSTHAPLARALALLAGLDPGVVLIDPCCGGGTIAIEAGLAERRIEIVGFDAVAASVADARRHALRAGVRARFAVADAGSLPLPNGSAARVATNPPWGRAAPRLGSLRAGLGPLWAELARILAPGGRAAVLVPPDSRIPGGFRTLLRNPVRLFGAVVEVRLLEQLREGQWQE